MVSVELYGGVFSSTLFDQIHAPSNQEGLLLGHVQLQRKSTISDADINSQSERLVYVIENTIHCPTPRYFYDKDGKILRDKLDKLLNNRPLQSLIGWYRSRQQSSLEMSMWERSIHYNLCDFLLDQQADNQTNLMFGLFTCEPNRSLSTRLQSTRFLVLKGNGKFAPIKFQVRNLGNTSSIYKLPVSSEYSTSAPQYTTVCNRHRTRLVDEPHQTVHSTKQMDSVANDMCCKLQELCTEVENSEVEVHTLLEEIEAMKKILCSTISQSRNLDADPQDGSAGTIPGTYEESSNGLPDAYVPDSDETGGLDNFKDSNGADGYLIDLTDYSADGRAANMSPIVKCTTRSSDSFEHIDIVHQQPLQSNIGVSSGAPLRLSKKTNTSAEPFSFVDDLLGEPEQVNSKPMRKVVVASDGDDEGEFVVRSSPPASPVY